MEDLEIEPDHLRFYQELFLYAENEGKVPALKATELFRSADLSNDVIREVS